MALQDVCGLHNTGEWLAINQDVRNNETPLHFFIPPSSTLPSTCSTTIHRPFPLTHGTTTLGFIFQGGVIAAADTRASAGGLVACPAVHKITPIHSHLVVTSSGSGADCMLWERILAREIRLYELRHKRRLSIRGTAKLLSLMLHPFKGTDVCVALTLCGWDKEKCAKQWNEDMVMGSVGPVHDTVAPKQLEVLTSADSSIAAAVSDQAVPNVSPSISPDLGPKIIYVCSDGSRMQGEVFSVGSGSPYAYGVLDQGLKSCLSREEALSLAREAVFRATHRDAYSGNSVDLFHITDKGWHRRQREDLKEEYYRERKRVLKIMEERKILIDK